MQRRCSSYAVELIYNVEGAAGVKGRCFGAQAVVAHGDGHIALSAAGVYLLGREVALGAYEDAEVVAGAVFGGHEAPLGVGVAVAHELLRAGRTSAAWLDR